MAIKTFTTGEVLTAADTNTYLANSGLVFISETAITNTATVIVSTCFSNTFDAYKVVLQGVKHATGDVPLFMQYRAGATTEIGLVYYDGRQTISWATGASATGATNGGSAHQTPSVMNATNVLGAEIFISNPKTTNTTTFFSQGMDGRIASGGARYGAGICDTTTSYDSLVFSCSSGSFAASGSIAVYGYRKG